MIKLALMLALGAAHGATAAPAPKEKTMTLEWKGQNGGPAEPGHRVITDAKGWRALWRALGQDAPALDFKTYGAVAVFLGEKPTGGWSAAFEEKPKDGDTWVLYTIRPPQGFATQAFTAPYAVRAVPRPAKGKILAMENKPR